MKHFVEQVLEYPQCLHEILSVDKLQYIMDHGDVQILKIQPKGNPSVKNSKKVLEISMKKKFDVFRWTESTYARDSVHGLITG